MAFTIEEVGQIRSVVQGETSQIISRLQGLKEEIIRIQVKLDRLLVMESEDVRAAYRDNELQT